MIFRIDLKIFILIILFFLTKQIKIYSILMLFILLHEFGHLIVGIFLGMKLEKLEVMPFGVSIGLKLKSEDYAIKVKNGNFLEVKKIIVALAGPVTNILIVFLVNMIDVFNNVFFKMDIVFANIVLAVFNILPIYPLDGGRIIKSVLYILRGKYFAEKTVHRISYITLIVITVTSSIAILYLKNIALFFTVIFLWLLHFQQHKVYKD